MILPFWPLVAVAPLTNAQRDDLLAPVAALWTLGHMFVLSAMLDAERRRGIEVAVLGMLPVPDRVVLDRVLQRAARRSLEIVPLLMAVMLVRRPELRSVAGLLAVAAAGLVGASIAVAGGLSLALAVPARLLPLGALIPAGLFATSLFAARLPGDLGRQAWTALRHSPGAWPIAAVDAIAAGAPSAAVLPFVLFLAALATMPWLIAWLRRGYRIAEMVFPAGAPPHARLDEPAPAEDSPVPPPVDTPVTREEMKVLWMADQPDPLARIALRMLSDTDRAVLELMDPHPAWTGRWVAGAVVCAMGVAAAWSGYGEMAFIVIVLALGLPLPLLGGNWPGLQRLPTGGGRSTCVIAPWPVGYLQMSRVLLTANAVRWTAGLPLVVAIFLLLPAWAVTPRQAASALACAVAVQPLLAAFRFASVTLVRGWRGVGVMSLLLLAMVVGAIAVIWAMLGGGPLPLCVGVIAAASAMAWAAYGGLYASSRGLDVESRVWE